MKIEHNLLSVRNLLFKNCFFLQKFGNYDYNIDWNTIFEYNKITKEEKHFKKTTGL